MCNDCSLLLEEFNFYEYLTLDEELQLLLRWPSFCLFNLDGHVEGEEQLVSLKQTYGYAVSSDYSILLHGLVEYSILIGQFRTCDTLLIQ